VGGPTGGSFDISEKIGIPRSYLVNFTFGKNVAYFPQFNFWGKKSHGGCVTDSIPRFWL